MGSGDTTHAERVAIIDDRDAYTYAEVQELADLGPSQVRTVSALYDGVCDAVEFSLR